MFNEHYIHVSQKLPKNNACTSDCLMYLNLLKNDKINNSCLASPVLLFNWHEISFNIKSLKYKNKTNLNNFRSVLATFSKNF